MTVSKAFHFETIPAVDATLNKNEKKTLKCLLADAKMSDSAIAAQLRISSQAVGKIRRKLENTVIKSYSVNVDYAKLGVQTFAIALAKMTHSGFDEGEMEIEERLISDPHVINVFRLPSGSYTHILLYGFRDIDEMENFFRSSVSSRDIHQFLDNRELFTFSHNSLIKNDPVPLFIKIIDSGGVDPFAEIVNFKKRRGLA